jgi:hypothetical protein
MTGPCAGLPRRRYVCHQQHRFSFVAISDHFYSHTKSRTGCETCKRRHIRDVTGLDFIRRKTYLTGSRKEDVGFCYSVF